MGKDEAVALLLDLADIDQTSYLKLQPDAAFPPRAAYDIAAASGLLPITLSITAQMVKVSGHRLSARIRQIRAFLTHVVLSQPPELGQRLARRDLAATAAEAAELAPRDGGMKDLELLQYQAVHAARIASAASEDKFQ